jgi:hypothetical protein
VSRGSAAALPDDDHRRVPPLPPASLVVRHVEEDSRAAQDFDFAELPVSEPLARSLAEVFAQRVGPDGIWRQLPTSRETFYYLTVFCRFLADQDDPVNDIEDLSTAVWAAWRLSRPSTVTGHRHISKVKALLLDHPRLPAGTRELMAKRGINPAAKEAAYSLEEFDQIKTFATRKFRSALLRIREHAHVLQQWRSGEFAEGSKSWRLGAALDYISHNGHPTAFVSGRNRVPDRFERILGGSNAEATWKRLFLDAEEGAAVVVLMIAAYGWNATTVEELALPESPPDAGGDGHVIYRMELQKRRRHIPHRYETRNLADFGADSPGRLITQVIEATAPARATLAGLGQPSADLILWHSSKLGDMLPETLFRSGLAENNPHFRGWQAELGLDRPVSVRRLRKTAVLGKKEPVQHSQDVHDSVYVLSDPRTVAEAADVIEAGISEAMHTAQAAVAVKMSRAEIGADVDTATAGCTGYTASPHAEPGSPCRASFLLCIACPNAVVTPRHLPRLAYLNTAMAQLRSVLPGPVWDTDWREHHRRLAELRRRPEFTDIEWSDALEQSTSEDRRMIDALLNGGFDA